MDGIFGGGGLPPGLQGFVAAQEMAQRRQQQGLNTGMGILQMQQLLRQQANEDQMQPLRIAQLQTTVDQARQNAALRSILQGQLTGAAPGAAPGGGQTALPAGAANATQIGAPGGGMGIPGVNPMAAALLLSGDAGMGKLGTAMQEANKPLVAREGAPIVERGPDGNFRVAFQPAPKLDQGQRYDFGSGQVSTAPGFIESLTGIEGAKTRAVEGAKAGLDLVSVPDGRGGTVMLPRSQAVAALGGGSPASLPELRTSAPNATDALRIAQEADARGQPVSVTAPGGAPALPFGNAPSAAAQAGERARAENAAKREFEAPQGALQAGSQFDNFKRLTDMATQVLQAPGLGGATGLRGAFPSVPGSNASSAEALIESMKAQVSGMKLQAMRDASKTGGAVGNVTEKEWPRLESMVAALNPKLDKASFKGQVDNLISEILISERRISDAYKQEYGNTRGAVPPSPREGGLTPAEQTELDTLRARFNRVR